MPNLHAPAIRPAPLDMPPEARVELETAIGLIRDAHAVVTAPVSLADAPAAFRALHDAWYDLAITFDAARAVPDWFRTAIILADNVASAARIATVDGDGVDGHAGRLRHREARYAYRASMAGMVALDVVAGPLPPSPEGAATIRLAADTVRLILDDA